MTVARVYTPVITNVVDIIGDVISNVRLEYDVTNNEKPFYEHGHPIEIVNTLQERTQSDDLKFKKFPLIALFEDFEAKGAEGLFKFKTTLNLIIAVDTDPNYKAAKRYEESFDKVLTPIYELFIKHMLRSRKLHHYKRTVVHSPIYHVYWGQKGLYGSDGNIFNDHIDAIEIKDLQANIYR